MGETGVMTNKVYVTDYDYPSLDIETKELQKIGVPLIPKKCHTSTFYGYD
jgi:hypothetical protein